MPGYQLRTQNWRLTTAAKQPGIIDLYDPENSDLAALRNETHPELDDWLEFIGAVRVDFDPSERVAAVQYDVAVPYPDAVADPLSQQYAATRVITLRDVDGVPGPDPELTMVDTAYYEPESERVITDPSLFPGLTIGGTFGIHRFTQCVGYASGFTSTGDNTNLSAGGTLGGGLFGPLMPFPIDSGKPCTGPCRCRVTHRWRSSSPTCRAT